MSDARLLSEGNNVQFIELSSTYDHLFSSPPHMERLTAVFDERSVTLHRFNTETGAASLTLSSDEMLALLESWHSYRTLHRDACLLVAAADAIAHATTDTDDFPYGEF